MKTGKSVLSLLMIGIVASAVSAEQKGNSLKFSLIAEYGFVSVLEHKVQFGKQGTYFSYRDNGGQDVLFPVGRVSVNAVLNRNTFVFLYQPLRLENQDLLDRSLLIDSLNFPAGTPVNFIYNFPFYRFSYLYELTPKDGKWDWGIGLTLQIRNATIDFASLDGELFRTNRDVGLVPALKTVVNWKLSEKIWLGGEIDGIYAPVSYLNGDDNEVTGAILDASVRAGYRISDPYALFFNLRYLGGGAEGQSDNFEPPSDGWVKNWLNLLTVTLGGVWSF